MANTLTDLIPDVYEAMDVVSREQVGMIPAVTLDPEASRAALGQVVRSGVAPAASAYDITPAVNAPDNGDQTIGNVPLSIKKSRGVGFRWNGEQSRGVNTNGPGARRIQLDQIAQAVRTLTNEMEADLCALHANASRAYGSTSVLFADGYLDPIAEGRKILVDNGAPTSDLQFVMDTTASSKLFSRTQLSKVNQSADVSFLRQGVLGQTDGFMLRESGQIKTHTAGDAASATTDTDGYAIGDTEITLASAGTGAILDGDVITFAGDSNQYVVASGDAAVGGGGTITLAAPGLRQAIAGEATNITVINTSTRNMAFARSAIFLAARLPALPDDGDMADDRTTIIDPVTGMPFELAVYKQYRQVRYEIGAAWGANIVKPEHLGLVMQVEASGS